MVENQRRNLKEGKKFEWSFQLNNLINKMGDFRKYKKTESFCLIYTKKH
jgi:hypothetical protein